MRSNPVSFLLLSMLMVAMLGGLVLLTILSLDIHFEQGRSTYSLDARGIDRISVMNTNGEVDITGSDTSFIVVGIMKETYLGRDSLDKVHVNVTTHDGEVKVRVTYDMRIPFFTVNLDISVPRNITLMEARLTNGHLRISNVSEAVKAHVVNGQMTVKNVDIIQRLSVANGDLSVRDVVSVGSLRVDSGNIDIDKVGTIGSIDVDSGDVSATEMGTVDSVDVTFGNIRLEVGSAAPNGTEIEMDAGDITIYLPQNATFSFDLEADSGSVSIVGFDPDYTLDRFDRKTGDVGDGSSALECRVKSGAIAINVLKEVS